MAKKRGRKLKEKLFFEKAEQLYLISVCFKKLDRQIDSKTIQNFADRLDNYATEENCDEPTRKIFNPSIPKDEKYGLLHTDTFYSFVRAVKANVPYYWDREELLLFLKFISQPHFIQNAKATETEFKLPPLLDFFVGKRFAVYLAVDPLQFKETEYSISKFIIEFTSLFTANVIRFDTRIGEDQVFPAYYSISDCETYGVLDFALNKEDKRMRLFFSVSQDIEEEPSKYRRYLWFGRLFSNIDDTFFGHAILGAFKERRFVNIKRETSFMKLENRWQNVLISITGADTEKPAFYTDKLNYRELKEKAVINKTAWKILLNHVSPKIINTGGEDSNLLSRSFVQHVNRYGKVLLPDDIEINIPSSFRPQYHVDRRIEWK